jgi:hypothetical protein
MLDLECRTRLTVQRYRPKSISSDIVGDVGGKMIGSWKSSGFATPKYKLNWRQRGHSILFTEPPQAGDFD